MDDAIAKKALRTFSYGMYIVTAAADEEVGAFTANWVWQVSFEPRMVAVSVEQDAHSLGVIRRGGVFAVNVLESGQRELAGRFGKATAKVGNKLAEYQYTLGSTGSPLLPEALASVECRVVLEHPVGDHVLFVGQVVMRCTASGNNPQECHVDQFMGTTYETVHVDADVENALAEVPAGMDEPKGDTGSGAGGVEGSGGLMGRRPIVVVDDQRRVVGLVTRPHLAMDMAKLQSGQTVSGRTESMQLVWRCTDCGYLLTRAEQLPNECPDCGAPREHFVLVTED